MARVARPVLRLLLHVAYIKFDTIPVAMATYYVAESTMITSSTLLLTLQRDAHERPISFQPGQYATISFEHKGRKSVARCFSIVSPPTQQDILQFSMRVRGLFTTALSKLQKDDPVEVLGPFGGFVFDVRADTNAVCMAGGIGITPMVSIMRHLATLNAKNDVTLLYSVATQDDVPFRDELLKIEAEHPNLKVRFVVGKGETNTLPAHHSSTGFITPDLLKEVTENDFKKPRFFICGPPPFMNAMVHTLAGQGTPQNHILTEAFTQSSPRQASILHSWPANVYAVGAISLALGSFVVMVSDLLKTLPPTSTQLPTKNTPFLVTNARQQQLDQLVNSIPPSASVITSPSAQQQTTTTTPSAPTTTTPQVTQPAPVTQTPVYTAPAAPRTTTSVAP